MKEFLPQIEEAKRGRVSALQDLYDRFAPVVRMTIYDRIGDLHAAWDVSQDVFVSVLTGIQQLKEPANFKHWLMGITRHKISDYLKAQHRERNRRSNTDVDSVMDDIQPSERDLRLQLREAIRDLNEKERLAVHLFYIEGQPVDLISELLDVHQRTIYMRLAAARRSLERTLADSHQECRHGS